jgi:hypothetical protein
MKQVAPTPDAGTSVAAVAAPHPAEPGTHRAGWVFDADFYRSVLQQLVSRESADREAVPVVELRLSDGTVLDVCQIMRLDERWMALSYYRDPGDCRDQDVAFVPYGAVARIHLSIHPPGRRTLGFNAG